ncbi:4Fe-4S binding domain protein [Mycobacterium xenopi 3993]|nr:4Fe-4S binding domain protein [Mycobacterium xenopi 3993]
MARFWDAIAGFGVTLTTMFKRPITEQYPEHPVLWPAVPRPPPTQPVSRRSGEVHRLRAVRLGLSGRRHLRRGRRQHRRRTVFAGERYGRVYQINYLRCIGCGLCVEACPTRR